MNIWGKVLAFFVILLGGTAFVLTTQMLDYRQSWLKQVDANQKQLVTARETTVAKRKELAALQAESDRVMLGWDTYVNNVQAGGDPNTGTLTVNVPLPEGKDKDGKPVMPIVYAFQPGANNQFEYVGEFRTEKSGAGGSTLKANWRMRPADAAMWKLGPNWRLRTRIPPADKKKFDQMSMMFTDIDERFANNTNELARSRDEFAKKVKTALSNRENAIQGFEAWQGDRGKLDDEAIDGVQASMVKEEEARNSALAEADKLRHELNATVEEFDKLNGINSKAAAALAPAPSSATGKSVSSR